MADRRLELAGDESAPIRLSPSRATAYKTCPQLFKFRVVDRIPEPTSVPNALGTLLHHTLEQLFQLDSHERTPENACSRMLAAWEELKQQPEYAGLRGQEQEAAWLAQAKVLLDNYFLVEDPGKVSPHELEWWVQHRIGQTLLRGIIDRVEIMVDGQWVLTDYKTGRSPSETDTQESFFGLKLYALLCWRAFGQMPGLLRLIYLKEPEVITLVPTRQMLQGLERQLDALSHAIRRAHEHNDWRPRVSRACNWCPHRSICPAWAAG